MEVRERVIARYVRDAAALASLTRSERLARSFDRDDPGVAPLTSVRRPSRMAGGPLIW